MTTDTVEQCWQRNWADIILNQDGTVNLDQVKKELADYTMVMQCASQAFYKGDQHPVARNVGELDEKLTKLGEFIESSPIFTGLPDDERERLVRQKSCMGEYSEILGERIAAF